MDINFLFSTSVLEKLNWLAPMPSHAVFALLLSRPDYDLVPAELENMCAFRCSLENLVDPPAPSFTYEVKTRSIDFFIEKHNLLLNTEHKCQLALNDLYIHKRKYIRGSAE